MPRRTKDIRGLSLSDFYCCKCGLKSFPIPRQPGKSREPGHLKKIFCIHCQQENNMAEVRSYGKYTLNDFWIEYEYGNFDEEGNRKEPWKLFVSKVKKGEIKLNDDDKEE